MTQDHHSPARGSRVTASNHSPQSFVCQGPGFIDPLRRHAMIAEAAYYAAERRGFAAGHELDDWLEACDEIDAALTIAELHRLYGCSDVVA